MYRIGISIYEKKNCASGWLLTRIPTKEFNQQLNFEDCRRWCVTIIVTDCPMCYFFLSHIISNLFLFPFSEDKIV